MNVFVELLTEMSDMLGEIIPHPTGDKERDHYGKSLDDYTREADDDDDEEEEYW